MTDRVRRASARHRVLALALLTAAFPRGAAAQYHAPIWRWSVTLSAGFILPTPGLWNGIDATSRPPR